MMGISSRRALLFAAIAATAVTCGAGAQESPKNATGQIVVTLQNHVFSPAEIRVTAGQRAELLIKNLDSTAEEFDSSALKVEKVIAGRSEGVVRLRALAKGSYPFTGEYHADTAKGVVVAE